MDSSEVDIFKFTDHLMLLYFGSGVVYCLGVIFSVDRYVIPLMIRSLLAFYDQKVLLLVRSLRVSTHDQHGGTSEACLRPVFDCVKLMRPQRLVRSLGP